MNTTITKDQITIQDGEVFIIDINHPMEYRGKHYGIKIFHNEHFGWQFKVNWNAYKILYSTAKLDGVKHLQREWFVKGEQDKLNDALCEWMNDEKDHYEAEAKALEFGYNAKKGEFTREEMIQAMTMTGAYADSNPKATHKDVMTYIWSYINSLRPLQLPEKIVLSPDGELIEIQW